jgi:hypothetical protein
MNNAQLESRFEYFCQHPEKCGSDSHTKRDPLAPSLVVDPWQAVIDHLDGARVETGEDWPRMAEALKILLRWVNEPALGVVWPSARNTLLNNIGRRSVSCQWVLEPGAFEGTPSGRELARRLGLPGTRLPPLCADFSRKFGVANRAQSHGRNGNHHGVDNSAANN